MTSCTTGFISDFYVQINMVKIGCFAQIKMFVSVNSKASCNCMCPDTGSSVKVCVCVCVCGKIATIIFYLSDFFIGIGLI